MRIRIPGWCKSYTLSVNGNKVDSTTDKGYTVIKEWKTGDLIVLNMDMPVEKVSADPRVRQNTGKRALQRGPLVYCLEETDNAKDFADLALTPTSSFEVKDEPDNLGWHPLNQSHIEWTNTTFHSLLCLGQPQSRQDESMDRLSRIT